MRAGPDGLLVAVLNYFWPRGSATGEFQPDAPRSSRLGRSDVVAMIDEFGHNGRCAQSASVYGWLDHQFLAALEPPDAVKGLGFDQPGPQDFTEKMGPGPKMGTIQSRGHCCRRRRCVMSRPILASPYALFSSFLMDRWPGRGKIFGCSALRCGWSGRILQRGQ